MNSNFEEVTEDQELNKIKRNKEKRFYKLARYIHRFGTLIVIFVRKIYFLV